MVNQILGLFWGVCFLPFSYGISQKEKTEAICVNNACYTVTLSQNIFYEASKECVNRRGNLLTIQNEEEAGHVYSLLWKFTNTTLFTRPLKLWIGLHLKEKSCVKTDHVLRGFSWITDTQDAKEGQFSNWLTEPTKTCTKKICVSMNVQMDSPNNFKWSEEPCSSQADGYICKFNFQGMCQKVVITGPGYVEYDTPFSFKSSSLDLVPDGSSASVSCGYKGEHKGHLFCLKTGNANILKWGDFSVKKSNGLFCASKELGCTYNNGGCEHECVEYPQNKSLSCRCRDGYVLAPDLVSCIYLDHCQSNPCEQKCINHRHGFECSCSSGFVLADNQVNCNNITGCLKGECNPKIVNDYENEELESEYNDTTSSMQRENEPYQTTQHSIIDEQIIKENTPKMTQSTLMPTVKTVSPNVTPANDALDCNALRSKLLLSILCFGAVLFS